jgi:hypothetical protein
VNMKERILISGMKYSVLKEEMKEDRCGWSNLPAHPTSPPIVSSSLLVGPHSHT